MFQQCNTVACKPVANGFHLLLLLLLL